MKKTLVTLALILMGFMAKSLAMPISEIRTNARFLSDRMAYELELNPMQYEDCYEINYDFLHSINPHMYNVCIGSQASINAYYDFLDARNEDLRYILNRTQYIAFMDLDYFFRPIYTAAGRWLFRVHQHYNNLTHYYFHTPSIYWTYNGAHARHHYHNGYYGGRYHHDVYAHVRPSREHVHHDFHRAPHHDVHHNAHHDIHHDAHHNTHHDAHHDSRRPQQNAHRDTHHDSHHTTPQKNAGHGSHATPHNSGRGSKTTPARNHSGAHDQKAAPRSNSGHGGNRSNNAHATRR